jgi:2-polyprenyl-3-methyl-5-hydroxy-6-metoxy-1,4-benzoquinol methylase
VPSQADIDAYYQALNTGLSSDASWQTEAGHKRQLWRKLLARVERTSGRGPLLDLGCGGGQFLQVAAACGWTEACGLEPSPKAVAIARSAVAAPVHEGSWKDVELQPERFAAISLFDVLEHDGDPHGLVAHCFNLLRPGGTLLVTVPNIHGLSIRCFGAEAYVIIPPEHISYFTAKSLRLLLLKAGFASPTTFTCDLYLKEWLRFFTRIQKSGAGVPVLPDGKAQYLKWHQRFSGGVALQGIRVVNALLAVLGCGDQLVAVAKKPMGMPENA